MKNLIYIIGIVAFLATSCELEEEIYDFYTPDNFYQSAEDAEIGVNACYGAFLGTGYGTWAYWLEEALGLDNDQVISRTQSRDGSFQFGTWSGSLQNFTNCWNTFYSAIHSCNSVIENVPNIVDIDETTRMRILAEARFLRGVAYFEMVRIWGGVPLRTETLSSSGDDGYLPRATAEQMYNQIIEDFLFANTHLLRQGSMDAGRATKEAAQGFLARVYLTMGGIATNSPYPSEKNEFNDYGFVNPTEAYTKARAWADSVITDGGLELYPDCEDLFSLDNQYVPEMMFALGRMNLADYGSPLATTYAVSNDYSGANWAGKRVLRKAMFKDYYENEYANGVFDDRDVKGLQHVFTENGQKKVKFWPKDAVKDDMGNTIVNWKDSALILYPGVNPAGFNPGGNNAWKNGGWIKKYIDSDSPTKSQHANNIPLLRYADVLLMWAEAENELNGPDNAFEKVDEVRERAGLDGMKAEMEAKGVAVTKENFVTYLLRERGKEFVGEFTRKHDLVRNGKYLEYMNAIVEDGNNEYARPRAEYQILYPIGTSVLDNNKAITSNNYGY